MWFYFYSRSYPHYTLSLEDNINNIEYGTEPILDCNIDQTYIFQNRGILIMQYKDRQCEIKYLSDVPYMKFHNPTLFYLIHYSWIVFIFSIVYSFQRYFKKGGKKKLKSDIRKSLESIKGIKDFKDDEKE